MMKLSALILLAIFITNQLYAKPLRRSRPRRNAYRNESRLWPKAVVPYTIDEAYSKHERSVIERAMKDIQSISCIRFKKQSSETAFVEIVRGKGCRAVVGYIGRRSKLSLGYGCIWVARVLHELLHVLGFFHEHTRPDRDEFVSIFSDNIKEASINNFRKMSESKVTTFGLPYDFRSVLHYHDREFAIDRTRKTLEPKVSVGGVVIGRAEELSKMDILKLNKLYHCPKRNKHRDYQEEEGSGLTELEDNFIIVSLADETS
ncbi:zinc metalloproteinase nas-7 [Caerostris darwini]|uniref:Metalloendopeptidase n=1 Tax=Caerostris darwini TaxID=1538125 RepID=A0AAV4WTQ7_9ARAC|nr:zinc metalloproteinase nas-7 [Caerostris darwini]